MNFYGAKAGYVVLLVCACAVWGCSSQMQDSPTAQSCDSRLPATGQEHTVPNPKKASSCKAVVLMCNYCKYDASGAFKTAGAQICGVCVGWDTQ
jgi:hypothetical protein